MKKLCKIISWIVFLAGAAVAAYLIVAKITNKKQTITEDGENFVSCDCGCDCCDEEFIAETVEEE
ncbi:MAG: hypothetical protein FWF08_10025 [Oscillospiraceae bacterium]|nr:hypothetical protein [Oscillospiraceae bacterium]